MLSERGGMSVTPVDVEIGGATGTVKAIINHGRLGRIIAMIAPP